MKIEYLSVFFHRLNEEDFFSYFYAPSKVAVRNDTSHLQQFFSSFPTNSLLSDRVNQQHPRAPFIEKEMASNFLNLLVVQSAFDHCCYLVVTSIIYRSCQLVAMAMQHKIAQTDWHPVTKVICSFAAFTLPVAIVYLAGGEYKGILLSTCLNTAAGLLPTIATNFFRTIDLISPTRRFVKNHFILQNVKSSIRYTLIDFMVLDRILGPLLEKNYLHRKVTGVYHYDGPLSTINLNNIQSYTKFFHEIISSDFKKASKLIFETLSLYYREVIVYNTPVYQTSVVYERSDGILSAAGMPSTLLSHFIEVCASQLGRLVVDGIFILLNQRGIAKDLRDPINSMFSKPITNANNTKITSTPSSTNSSRIVIPDKLRQEKWKKHLEQNPSQAASQPNETDTHSSQSRKKTKATDTASSSHTTTTTTQETMTPQKEREPIHIPGYTRTIVPLHGQGAQPNMWGLITYDLQDHDKQPLEPYLTGLISAHIGNQTSAIKWLGNGRGKFEGKTLYEIRPKSLGDRLLGYVVNGEEAINNALQHYLPYEVTLPFFEQMQDENQPVSLIIFSEKLKHEDVRKYLK